MRYLCLALLLSPISIALGGDNTGGNWAEFRNGGSSCSTCSLPVTWSPRNTGRLKTIMDLAVHRLRRKIW